MIHEPVTMIEATAELENTYIFFTTDNGYHISQHRMNPGKSCGYNTDSNVPLFVSGPEIEEGGIVDTVAGHINVAATLLQLAGVEKQLNGEAIQLTSNAAAHGLPGKTEHAAIEYWGLRSSRGPLRTAERRVRAILSSRLPDSYLFNVC